MEEIPAEVNALSRRIVGAALSVHTALGAGYAEAVYEEALCVELRSLGIPLRRQVTLRLLYRDQCVGTHRLDLLVGESIVVEAKTVDVFAPIHFAQVLSYLRATRLALGLLINFNVPHLRNGIRRVIAPRPA